MSTAHAGPLAHICLCAAIHLANSAKAYYPTAMTNLSEVDVWSCSVLALCTATCAYHARTVASGEAVGRWLGWHTAFHYLQRDQLADSWLLKAKECCIEHHHNGQLCRDPRDQTLNMSTAHPAGVVPRWPLFGPKVAGPEFGQILHASRSQAAGSTSGKFRRHAADVCRS